MDTAQTATAERRDLKKAEETRLRILNAAARTFRSRGFAATRLSDIAAHAELRAGSMYYHFESKEKLLEEVLELGVSQVFKAVRAAVEALPEGATWREKTSVAIATHLESMWLHDDYTSANIRIFGHIPDDIRLSHLKRQREYGNYWRSLLTGARDAGEIRDDLDLSVVRMLLLGSLNWSVEWHRKGQLSPAEIGRQAAVLLFEGLTPR